MSPTLLSFPPLFYSVTPENCGGCGGTLISNRRVLTAARCFSTQLPVGVRVGALTIDDGTYIGIESIVIHPGYKDGASFDNDVAIATMASTTTVNPATINRNRSLPSGTENIAAIAYDFGGINAAGDSSIYLRRADTAIETETRCKQLVGSDLDKSILICALNGFASTCGGDIGGPLVTSTGLVMGILSFGPASCALAARRYDAWTNIAAHTDWIDANLDVPTDPVPRQPTLDPITRRPTQSPAGTTYPITRPPTLAPVITSGPVTRRPTLAPVVTSAPITRQPTAAPTIKPGLGNPLLDFILELAKIASDTILGIFGLGEEEDEEALPESRHLV